MATNKFIYPLLIDWYAREKRDLPWRLEKNPYRVWLSEIMLQQTKVSQGLPYFERFTEQFPTLAELASAKEEDVLRLWQGLGYYSRARNLLKCAKIVQNNFNGRLPSSAKELSKLPGIGPYTAAAIASICYGEKIAVVDGNVQRVIARLFAIKQDLRERKTLQEIESIAQELLLGENAEDYNQGIMELGALICHPKKPQCPNCPLQENCLSHTMLLTEKIPFKSPAKKAKKRVMEFDLLVNHENKFVVEQRQNEKDIWYGLYQLPVRKISEAAEGPLTYGQLISQHELPKHQLSHQSIYASINVYKGADFGLTENQRLVNINEYNALPKPQLFVNCTSLIEENLGT